MGRKIYDVPEITTQRLKLDRLKQTDAEGIFSLRSDPEIIKYTFIKQYISIEEARAYIKRIDNDIAKGECVVWSIRLKETGDFVGSICLWDITENGTCAEIGYDSLPPFHGKGLVSEAVKAVIEYGFEGMGLTSIVADLRTENTKSVKLLQRNGFILGKVHMSDRSGEDCEMAFYSLERKDCTLN